MRQASSLLHRHDRVEVPVGNGDGSQAVVWQTAIDPVVALELLSTSVGSGAGVLGPKASDAVPFLDVLNVSRRI